MSKTDPDGLDPLLKSRLRAELSAVRPPSSLPRYRTAAAPVRALRLAPVALAIAFTGILALTAFAATGSPNPAVWTQRVETVINPPSPSPTQGSVPEGQPRAVVPAAPIQRPAAEPTERTEPVNSPEPAESPEPSASPEPSGDGGSSSSPPSPGPSPTPDH